MRSREYFREAFVVGVSAQRGMHAVTRPLTFVKLFSGLRDNKVRKMLKNHLDEVHMSYVSHLGHAWRLGFILLVHGLMPWIWTHKVRDEICDP